jgi:predicted Fe-S protein YdhL (DUF1289 family)
MAFFPKIQSPCPYKGNLAAVMDGDQCRMCKRQVVDLTAWSDGERIAFLADCKDEVCVSYRLPLRPALAAAALAAASLPAAAFAQDSTAAPAAEASTPAAPEQVAVEDMEVFVGGITDPANAEFASAEELAAIPEVPVAYEDEAPAPAAAKPGA